MPKTSLVLTILGKDRPGLIESIAQLVTEHGGNWVESRMAHMAGQFAGILRVEVEQRQAGPLTEALRSLEQQGLESVVHADQIAAAPSESPSVRLELVGQDQPGIIRQISRVLVSLAVNVEELGTQCTTAPNSGQALFRLSAQLRLPASLSEDELRHALEQVAADLMVDITLGAE